MPAFREGGVQERRPFTYAHRFRPRPAALRQLASSRPRRSATATACFRPATPMRANSATRLASTSGTVTWSRAAISESFWPLARSWSVARSIGVICNIGTTDSDASD